MNLPNIHNCTISVIGLGYVGLPLALSFSKGKECCRTGLKISHKVIGYDTDKSRIDELRTGFDRTNEIDVSEKEDIKDIVLTFEENLLKESDVFIITVPTPVNKSKKPDLKYLKAASKTVGKAIAQKNNDNDEITPVIIFESTVFPGTVEDICVPIIEAESNFNYNSDDSNNTFVCGYSPERINPGDPNSNVLDIVKVTSGSNPNAANWVDQFYGSIIKAGTHKASTIKVAEAAKVIENTQRDLNIALINELARIFKLEGIDTLDVIEAASTKWNFSRFYPGLVGGHCISVDPYYLTYRSEQLGYYPEIILAARRLNDNMAKWIIQQLIKSMAVNQQAINGCKFLIMGLTFKENCPDLRNTGVLKLIENLEEYGIKPAVVDPTVSKDQAKKICNIDLVDLNEIKDDFDAIIVAVGHNEFKALKTQDWTKLIKKSKGIIYDLKGIVPRELNPMRL
tara:strand:+ start:6038 stop:7399 length:1362 start_codon:yes stop_codon:yes gene_type:complete